MVERSMRRLRFSMAACGVAMLVMSGCSSDGKEGASPTTSSPSSTPAPRPTTTVRSVDTSFSGQNSAQFCSLAKTYNDRFTSVGTASTPAQLRSATQDGRTAINQAVSAAPAEIKPDVQVLANAFAAMFTELERVNFDPSKVSVAALTPLQAPEFQAATIRFQAYVHGVCGLTG